MVLEYRGALPVSRFALLRSKSFAVSGDPDYKAHAALNQSFANGVLLELEWSCHVCWQSVKIFVHQQSEVIQKQFLQQAELGALVDVPVDEACVVGHGMAVMLQKLPPDKELVLCSLFFFVELPAKS